MALAWIVPGGIDWHADKGDVPGLPSPVGVTGCGFERGVFGFMIFGSDVSCSAVAKEMTFVLLSFWLLSQAPNAVLRNSGHAGHRLNLQPV